MVDFIDIQYRFKRNAEHEKYMKFFSETKILSGYRDIMMLSAMIGYENEEYQKIEKSASDTVLMMFFNDEDRVLIDLIAYAHTKDQNILSSRSKYEIFEKYYNGGFPILLKLLDITQDKILMPVEESYVKELTIKLYRILRSYNIYEKEVIEIN